MAGEVGQLFLMILNMFYIGIEVQILLTRINVRPFHLCLLNNTVWVFVLMRPRVLLYYFTISVLSFIPFYCVIPCLILSSLPLSLVSCHLLGGPIPSPCFPVLYPCFHGPCRPFVLVIHWHPDSCYLNPLVFHSPQHAIRSGVPHPPPSRYRCRL